MASVTQTHSRLFYTGWGDKTLASRSPLLTPDTHCSATVDRRLCSATVHSHADNSLFVPPSKINFTSSISTSQQTLSVALCLFVCHTQNSTRLPKDRAPHHFRECASALQYKILIKKMYIQLPDLFFFLKKAKKKIPAQLFPRPVRLTVKAIW